MHGTSEACFKEVITNIRFPTTSTNGTSQHTKRKSTESEVEEGLSYRWECGDVGQAKGSVDDTKVSRAGLRLETWR
jgi:hypothetical protein